MMTGTCRLCLETAELQESHFLPSSVYSLLRLDGDPGGHPIMINIKAGKAVQTSLQVTGYMLCVECEDRLNKGGESWTLGNCWRTDEQFPLREALWSRAPVMDEGNYMAFDAKATAGVEVDKLVYFGSSVFWRATLSGWRKHVGDPPEPLDFGQRYTEGLRKYLLGDAGFPADMVMLVSVAWSRQAMPYRGYGELPYMTGRTPYHKYRFVLLGITFHLLIGKGIPQFMRNACTHRSGLIHCSADMDTGNLSSALRGLRNVKPSRKLRDRMLKAREKARDPEPKRIKE